MERHVLGWFEIPVKDFERAKNFYETILGIEMQTESLDGTQMAFFPPFNGMPPGCLTNDEHLTSSDSKGPLLYLSAGTDLTELLDKVEPAGGKVLQGKKPVSPEYGFYALFLDTEGNKLGMVSPE